MSVWLGVLLALAALILAVAGRITFMAQWSVIVQALSLAPEATRTRLCWPEGDGVAFRSRALQTRIMLYGVPADVAEAAALHGAVARMRLVMGVLYGALALGAVIALGWTGLGLVLAGCVVLVLLAGRWPRSEEQAT